LPKTIFVEDRLTIGAGVTPVPVSGTVSGLPVRLFAMFRLPVRLPVAAGVNVTLMEQVPPTDTLPRQLSVSAKSEAFVPLIVMLVMLSAIDSPFLKLTVWDTLVMPVGWFENDRLVGKTTTSKTGSNKSAELKAELLRFG
jgi:hypothetical protein